MALNWRSTNNKGILSSIIIILKGALLDFNKTISLLRCLNDKEFKQFGRYIKSDNSKTQLELLYKYLAKYYPVFKHKNFNRKSCGLFLFPELKQTVNSQGKEKAEKLLSRKLKNPFHSLSQALDNFLINLELEQDSFEKNMLLLKSFRRRKLDEECINRIDKELQKRKKSKTKYLFQPLEEFQYLQFKRNLTNKLNCNTVNIEPLLSNLDEFYFNAKLIYNCEIVTHNKISGKENENQLVPEILQLVEKNQLKNSSSSILLNAYLFKLLSTNSKIEYDFVKDFYFENFENLVEENKINAFTYLINHWTLGSGRLDKDKILKEVFNLYNFAIEKGILIEDKTIDSSNFKNIVTASTALNKHDWAFNFIKENKKYLKIRDAENVIKLSLARVHQSKGEDEKVIKLVQDIIFQDVFDNIVVRTIMVKSYFSLNEWHTLDFYFESFQKFIKRNKAISSEQKLALTNMISLTKRLVKAKTGNAYSKKSLQELLQNTKPLFMSSWLENKINQL